MRSPSSNRGGDWGPAMATKFKLRSQQLLLLVEPHTLQMVISLTHTEMARKDNVFGAKRMEK